jgi:hypothetical protein
MWKKGNSSVMLVKSKISTTIMETIIEVAHKVKYRTLWSINPTTGISQKEIKSVFKDILHSHLHCNIIHNNQGNQPINSSIDEWIKKMWYRYTMEYDSVLENREMLSFITTCMSLENITKWNKPTTEKQIIWFHLQVKPLKIEFLPRV